MLLKGKTAPDFTLPDKDNKQISLTDFRGHKTVVYFYPKDDTPGCTKQACAFRNKNADFSKIAVTVIGISNDSTKSHLNFSDKYKLPFLLLSDKDRIAIKAYDVQGTFGTMRVTYIIDENGMIEKVFEKASPDTNATDILAYLENEK